MSVVACFLSHPLEVTLGVGAADWLTDDHVAVAGTLLTRLWPPRCVVLSRKQTGDTLEISFQCWQRQKTQRAWFEAWVPLKKTSTSTVWPSNVHLVIFDTNEYRTVTEIKKNNNYLLENLKVFLLRKETHFTLCSSSLLSLKPFRTR